MAILSEVLAVTARYGRPMGKELGAATLRSSSSVGTMSRRDAPRLRINQLNRRYHSTTSRVAETSQRVNEAGDHVMFITGATGEFAPGLIARALRRNIQLIACSRREKQSPDPTRLQWVQIKEDDCTNPDAWTEQYYQLAKQAKRVSVVNLIGAAVPPPGKTLEDVNVRPVLAIHKGLQEFASDQQDKKVTMVHMSSICASVMGDAHYYSAMRKHVDEELTTDTDRISAVVFRPGLVFNDLQENNMVNMGHPYSPEQFATLPIHPVIGSGEQIQQPVYWGDLSDAVINATYTSRDAIIEAVGPESMTQAEMFEFFVRLRGGTFRKVRIPYEFGAVMAKHFPMGRIAPYSIAAFEKLDDPNDKPYPTEPFEEFVGHSLTSMTDAYYRVDSGDGPIILARPPIMRHAKQIAQKLLSDGEARRDVLSVTWKYGIPIIQDSLAAVFSPKE